MRNFGRLLAIFFLIGVHVPARAQLPSARLSTAFPPGGQQGTDVEVTVAGTDLDELRALHFSSPLITAQPKKDPNTGAVVPNVFVVRVGRDVPPGAYDVRAVGRFGVTNPRAFVVDREPHAAAKAGNTSPEAAAELAINSGVYAQAAATASQFYRVNLKAHRRVSIEVHAAEIDSMLEPVVVVFDPAGRELARETTTGSINFTPASDGAYVVQVHDVLYRGGAEYFYRLRVREGPKVEFVLPPALRPNEVNPFALFGFSLPDAAAPSDGNPFERLETRVLAPDDGSITGLGGRWFLPPQAGMLDGEMRYAIAGAPNPVFLARVDGPLVAEQADNDDPAKAQKVTPPAEVYGQFFPRGDRDWLSFDARKGEAFWIEVVSNRLLDHTDPVVIVQRVTKDEKGNEVATDVKEAFEPENVPGMPREFYAAHRDPAFRFAAPEDGTYRLLVRDAFNQNADDPRRVYRLSIAPAAQREDFRLVAWPKPQQPLKATAPGTLVPTELWGSNLRPGGIMPVTVLAFRTGSFAGDITLTAEDLPPGVSCMPVTMFGNTNTATLLVAADENAPASLSAIRILGTASGVAGSQQPTSRVARSGTVVWGVTDPASQPLRSRVAQELMLAVTGGEAAPIAVRPAEHKAWENSVAGVIEVPLKLTRRLGYAAAVSLQPAGSVPQLLNLPPFEIPAGQSEGKLTIDVGGLQLPPGGYCCYLQATSTAAYNRYPAQLDAANIAKAAADKATPELAAAVQKATEVVAAAKAEKVAEKIAAAEKALAIANEKVKQNEAAKASLAEQVKALTPKPTLAYGYSTPIHFKVTPAPVTLSVPAPTTPLTPGGKLDVPVTITRLYGFADVVELTVTQPQSVAGISAAKVTVAADKSQATVTIQAAADAKPGDYALTLTAAMKQNNRPVSLAQTLSVKVSPVARVSNP